MTKLTSNFHPIISTFHTLLMRRIHNSRHINSRSNIRHNVTFLLARTTRAILRLTYNANGTSRLTVNIMRISTRLIRRNLHLINKTNRSLRRNLRTNTHIATCRTNINRHNRHTNNLLRTSTRTINRRAHLVRYRTRIVNKASNLTYTNHRHINRLDKFNTHRIRLFRNNNRRFNNITCNRTIKHYRIRYTTRATKRGVQNQ